MYSLVSSQKTNVNNSEQQEYFNKFVRKTIHEYFKMEEDEEERILKEFCPVGVSAGSSTAESETIDEGQFPIVTGVYSQGTFGLPPPKETEVLKSRCQDDTKYMDQIRRKIAPNRRYPYVRLKRICQPLAASCPSSVPIKLPVPADSSVVHNSEVTEAPQVPSCSKTNILLKNLLTSVPSINKQLVGSCSAPNSKPILEIQVTENRQASTCSQKNTALLISNHLFKCLYCHETFPDHKSKNSHEKVHGTRIYCQFCSAGFNHPIGLALHKASVHEQEAMVSKSVQQPQQQITKTVFRPPPSLILLGESNSPTFAASVQTEGCEGVTTLTAVSPETGHQCSKCNLKFSLKSDRDKHETRHPVRIQCQFCPLKCSPAGLIAHNLKEHSNFQEKEMQNKRNESKEKSIIVSEAQSSILGNLLRQKLASPISGQKPSSNSSFDPKESENINNSGPNTNQANYSQQPQYQNVTVYKPSTHTSLLCNLKTPSLSQLMRHTGGNRGIFTCKDCTAGFKTGNALYEHTLWNCPKTKPQSDLVSKKSTESIKCPYSCPMCSRTFMTNWNLSCHEKTHGNNFLCSYCPAGFNTSAALNSHLAWDHPKSAKSIQKPSKNSCMDCNLTFCRPSGLEAHRIALHQNQLDSNSEVQQNDGQSNKDLTTEPISRYPRVSMADPLAFTEEDFIAARLTTTTPSIKPPSQVFNILASESIQGTMLSESINSTEYVYTLPDVIPITVLKMED